MSRFNVGVMPAGVRLRDVPRSVEMDAYDRLEPELRAAIAAARFRVSAAHVLETRGRGVSVERCLEILRRSEENFLRRAEGRL